MEQLSRMNLYQNMIDKELSESLLFVIRVNMQILDRVEGSFLTSDIANETKEYDYGELLHQMRRNVQRLDELTEKPSWRSALKVLKGKLIKHVDVYEKKDSKNGRNLFNQIIKELSVFNDKIVEEKDFNTEIYAIGNRTQVFLSHAYEDKAYTGALFDYFYNRGIYLYVDWMHQKELNDGREIKRGLKSELRRSSQLLFLRTLNSELDIQGKQYLKPWCSWELGGFYNANNPNEKYLLNLYSVDGYKNTQLHGLKLFTGVVGQRLQGREIIP